MDNINELNGDLPSTSNSIQKTTIEDQPSTSNAIQDKFGPTKKTTFEDLLLQKIARAKNSPIKQKKVLNSNFADVITRDDYLKQLESAANEKGQKKT